MYTPAMSDFDALAFGTPHPGTLNYIRQRFDNLSTALSDRGREFMADARVMWDKFMGSAAIRKARAVKEKLLDGMYLRNEIQQYTTIGQFQSATPLMQGYIMACPEVKQMYYDQRLDGYTGSYVDPNPGMVGWDDPAYRMVMNGVAVDHPEHDFHIRVVLDDLPEGVNQLQIDEKMRIMATWDILRSYLEAGKEDPTSQEGGYL